MCQILLDILCLLLLGLKPLQLIRGLAILLCDLLFSLFGNCSQLLLLLLQLLVLSSHTLQPRANILNLLLEVRALLLYLDLRCDGLLLLLNLCGNAALLLYGCIQLGL